jgi:TolB-like protein/Flp pilus assembly protein TadD
MAEDLITDLSKISGLFVAARNSSFSFKGQMPDVKEVAQKLDVAFVLEGSVRKMGDRLRINAQLIESADGGHVWAERYDGDIAEIFDFQDRIREEIVAALKIQLNPTDAARTKPNRTGNIEAYDLFLQGKGKYFRYDPDALSEAFSCLERSIELDPEFADAYSYLASCHLMTYGHRWLTVDENLEQALWAAEKAVSLDSDSPIAHARLGFIQNWRHDYDDAEKSFENAVSLGPDVAEVLVYDAMHNLHIGNPELGMELARKAIALDPFTPVTDFVLGIGHQLLGQLNEAVVKLEAARDRTPKQLWVRLQLVAAYMEMGQATEASREIAVIAQNSPEMTVEIIEKMAPYRSADVIRRFVDFLRQAGLPEGARAEAAITPPALADKPSIAVLPFDNLSGDAGQDFIGDGLTEDIIAGLSRIRSFFVIARNSTFQYKGTSPDIRRVAEELGVRYVLEGSVRKAGDRIRVTAQLIDAPNNIHIWAERFDRDFTDIFAVQDEITGNIVGQLVPELGRAEYERVKAEPPHNLDAWGVVPSRHSIPCPADQGRNS